MDDTQKNFILTELIPFVLREQGSGFDMNYWVVKKKESENLWAQLFGYEREPACGTVCCVGGSIEILKPNRDVEGLTGLNPQQQEALFFGWQGNIGQGSWPLHSVKDYREARTPLRRAEIACDVLREIVETNGACLIVKEEDDADAS